MVNLPGIHVGWVKTTITLNVWVTRYMLSLVTNRGAANLSRVLFGSDWKCPELVPDEPI